MPDDNQVCKSHKFTNLDVASFKASDRVSLRMQARSRRKGSRSRVIRNNAIRARSIRIRNSSLHSIPLINRCAWELLLLLPWLVASGH